MPTAPTLLSEFTQARFGLFVHYGLYSLLGRGEWVRNRQAMGRDEYAALANQFTAPQFDANELCDLALAAGMRYIVMTTMHHDGFRLYDTQLSDFSTAATAAGRDLIQELVTATRAKGLKLGLYHSLNNWHDQPDAVAALEDPAACETFISRTHKRIQELVTRYNPIDILWYDGWWPLDAKGWRAPQMNEMVRAIQPHILFNGRNGLPGDFATPEQHATYPKPWRPWEACITLNNSWGFHAGDHDWKSPRQVIDLLATIANGKGNLLLNVGLRGDGSVPPEAAAILKQVGDWIARCGECVFDTDLFTFDLQQRGEHRSDWCHHGPFTARGNSLYLLLPRWPGQELTIGGVKCAVNGAKLLPNHNKLTVRQEQDRVTVIGLPVQPPDPICPVIRFDCDRPPMLYLTGGMREPAAPHPHYDPCPSDMVH